MQNSVINFYINPKNTGASFRNIGVTTILHFKDQLYKGYSAIRGVTVHVLVAQIHSMDVTVWCMQSDEEYIFSQSQTFIFN